VAPDGALLDWASQFTGLPRADLEEGFARIGDASASGASASPGATGSPTQGNGADTGADAGVGAGAANGTSGAPAKQHGHVKSVPGNRISADMRAFDERFARVTGQIMHTVEINALLLGAGIESACIDFKNYTSEKVEKMRQAEEMDKLAMEILGICTTAVSGGFAAFMIEGEIAHEVFKTLAETTVKVVTAKAAPTSAAGFEKFVDALISGAKQSGHDAGSAAIAIVRSKVVSAEKAVKAAKDSGVSVSGSKEYSFVEHFLFEESSRFDRLVARYVGIPTPEMVNKFAEKFIRATRDPIEGIINDTAGEDSFRVAADAMWKLKKKHGFNYED
jgi:hypothetical protein